MNLLYTLKNLSHACIQLEVHSHQVGDSQCMEFLEVITGLIADKMAKISSAKTSAIALATSKESLNTYSIHYGLGPKGILRDDALEIVMDKFHLLSSSNVHNIIFSFRNNNKDGGKIDRIFDMNEHTKMEYIHYNVFMV